MSEDINTDTAAPDVDPRPPERFWESTAGVDALADPRPYGQENALQKLGRPPFERSARSKFRVLGYLATVYEHVARDVGDVGGVGGVGGAGDGPAEAAAQDEA